MKIEFTWDEYEVPEYDPEKHNPERVFAMLCYRGIHYAKWVVLDPFKIKSWSCLLYTSPSPRDISGSRMPSSA